MGAPRHVILMSQSLGEIAGRTRYDGFSPGLQNMCGIIGFTGPRDDALLGAMNSKQRHRGPDDGGAYFDERDLVSLAMRRLSILDIAGGHQPMLSEDKQLCVVFNGEILNAPELRRRLERDGARFVTDHSDTEVLLHLYAREGERMLESLNGMFGFVIHDRRRRILFGARDHFGIKPLYYSLNAGRFAFASELKTLELLPDFDSELCPEALSHYLSFQCVPSPLTIYRRTNKLPAAHSFVFDLTSGNLRTQRYWRPPAGDASHGSIAPHELASLVRGGFEAAVGRWMLSDVPVACSLSGGIDSSVIVAMIAANSSHPVPTYTLGFDDAPEIDERQLAQEVARRWKTDHHEIVLRSDELLSELAPMVVALDEPYAGGLPSWFVFRGMAADAVKVCMTGTGGDELFGNYGKWRSYESPWRALRVTAGRVRRTAGWLREYRRYPIGSRYAVYFNEAEKRSMLRSEPRSAEVVSERLIETLWQESQPATVRDGVRLVDLQIQLPDEFLHMTDRFSMAHSIEARPPFLDRTFAEELMAIPAHLRIGGTHLKQVLIDAVADLLPPELLQARKKGFVLPMAAWLRGKLRLQVEKLLGEPYLRRQGIFDERITGRLVRPHLDGRADHSSQIWTLLMFQLWHARSSAQ
jgi:asparagine synthase (glutamine-hydrolysing)